MNVCEFNNQGTAMSQMFEGSLLLVYPDLWKLWAVI